MGTDIHSRVEVRKPYGRTERLSQIQKALGVLDKTIDEYSESRYEFSRDVTAYAILFKKSLIDQRDQILLGKGQGVGWVQVGPSFSSSNYSDYDYLNRENAKGLSDGELLDAIGFSVSHHIHGQLSSRAQEVVKEFADRKDIFSAQARAIRDEWRAALGAANISYPSGTELDHDLFVKPRVDPLRGELRRQTSIDPGIREEIIGVCADSDHEIDIWIEGDDQRKFLSREPYQGRNYHLFAILADVRNGRGFAGDEISKPWNVIAPPRGFPIDLSPETVEWVATYEHTPSYHTLAQLQDFDWDQPQGQEHGVVDEESYKKLLETGERPSEWSSSISGPGIRIINDFEYPAKRGEDERLYIRTSWPLSYQEAVGEDWFRAMEEIEALIPEGGTADDVRMVFYFDS